MQIQKGFNLIIFMVINLKSVFLEVNNQLKKHYYEIYVFNFMFVVIIYRV